MVSQNQQKGANKKNFKEDISLILIKLFVVKDNLLAIYIYLKGLGLCLIYLSCDAFISSSSELSFH